MQPTGIVYVGKQCSIIPWQFNPVAEKNEEREHLTYAMSINTYRCQQLENLQLDHKEK